MLISPVEKHLCWRRGSRVKQKPKIETVNNGIILPDVSPHGKISGALQASTLNEPNQYHYNRDDQKNM